MKKIVAIFVFVLFVFTQVSSAKDYKKAIELWVNIHKFIYLSKLKKEEEKCLKECGKNIQLFKQATLVNPKTIRIAVYPQVKDWYLPKPQCKRPYIYGVKLDLDVPKYIEVSPPNRSPYFNRAEYRYWWDRVAPYIGLRLYGYVCGIWQCVLPYVNIKVEGPFVLAKNSIFPLENGRIIIPLIPKNISPGKVNLKVKVSYLEGEEKKRRINLQKSVNITAIKVVGLTWRDEKVEFYFAEAGDRIYKCGKGGCDFNSFTDEFGFKLDYLVDDGTKTVPASDLGIDSYTSLPNTNIKIKNNGFLIKRVGNTFYIAPVSKGGTLEVIASSKGLKPAKLEASSIDFALTIPDRIDPLKDIKAKVTGKGLLFPDAYKLIWEGEGCVPNSTTTMFKGNAPVSENRFSLSEQLTNRLLSTWKRTGYWYGDKKKVRLSAKIERKGLDRYIRVEKEFFIQPPEVKKIKILFSKSRKGKTFSTQADLFTAGEQSEDIIYVFCELLLSNGKKITVPVRDEKYFKLTKPAGVNFNHYFNRLFASLRNSNFKKGTLTLTYTDPYSKKSISNKANLTINKVYLTAGKGGKYKLEVVGPADLSTYKVFWTAKGFKGSKAKKTIKSLKRKADKWISSLKASNKKYVEAVLKDRAGNSIVRLSNFSKETIWGYIKDIEVPPYLLVGKQYNVVAHFWVNIPSNKKENLRCVWHAKDPSVGIVSKGKPELSLIAPWNPTLYKGSCKARVLFGAGNGKPRASDIEVSLELK